MTSQSVVRTLKKELGTENYRFDPQPDGSTKIRPIWMLRGAMSGLLSEVEEKKLVRGYLEILEDNS